MATKKVFIVCSHKEFQHAFRLAHRKGLSVGTPERLPTLVGDALLLQLVFRRTYAGSLGFGKDSCRHDVETNAILLSKNVIDSTNSLHFGSVGQHLTSVDVANGIETRWITSGNGGDTEIVVDGDGTIASEGNAKGFEVQSLRTGLTACSHQNHVSIDVFQRLHGSLHMEGNATLLEQFPQTLGNVAIQRGNTLLQILNHSYLGTKAIENTGELHADDACSDDAETFGQRVEVQQACAVNDSRVVKPFDRNQFGFRTRSDDDVLGRVSFVTCDNHGDSPLDLRFAAITGTVPMILKRGLLANKGNVGMRKDAIYPTAQLRNDLRHTFASLSKGS